VNQGEQGMEFAETVSATAAHALLRPKAAVQLMGCGEGMPVGLHYRKGWALLGYLAIESGRQHSRTSIAALLWPELDERAALTNLRQVLVDLNRYCERVLGPGVLVVQRTAVGLHPDGASLFDVDVIQQNVEQSFDVLLQGREFLQGMEDIAGVDFQSWLEGVRQILDAQLVGAAEAACDVLIANRQWRRALPLVKALIQRDPWNEANARRMMLVHVGSGMRAAAVIVYKGMERVLKRELGVEPADETRQLFAKICEVS
jgi:DNA-binding SARP family transcriptional activator